ncbi:Allantoicase [Dispira parvispora]|uniref:Allantoicase n=1 Tax=Dispira parvispora TaxID=1520584 RepID=A0A9W8E7G3_9FUNG|nr:Allantoicase [Dispira parvispora]
MSDLVTCITVSLVNQEAYEPYGQVVYSPTPSSGGKAQVANQGTARRYNHVVELENFRSEPNACSGSIPAVPNMCIFQCDPQWQPGSLFHVRLLERHQHSTQCFMPIARPLATNVGGDYLVIVALNGADDRPDVATLRAFIGRPWQGITYRPGIWHHPMVALTQVSVIE